MRSQSHLAGAILFTDVAKRRKRGRKFTGKLYVAKGLFVEEMTEELWTLLAVGNDLRNSIAHGDK